jgi:phage gpG-like protein
MALTLKITRNDISPALSRLARGAARPAAVLRAMGTTFKSITEGNFNSVGAQYRPAPWRAKRDGTPSNLQKSTTLAKSFRLEVTNTYARVSNPMVYAPIHQFGGKIKPKKSRVLTWVGADGKRVFARSVTMPARPFFPVLDGKLTAAAERLIGNAARRVMERQAGTRTG